MKAIGLTVLVLALGLGTLHASFEATTAYRMPWIENVRAAVRFLRTRPDHQWLAQNWLVAARLNYESGFSRGFSASDGELAVFRRDAGLQVAPPDIAQVGSAYVIRDEFFEGAGAAFGAGPPYLHAPPATWREIARFGEINRYRMRIYEVLMPAAGRE